ncbi:hypothetical protein HDC90_004918, partial [Pedobacter sp. AK013]|nr:hypothetical protein [Pedobacter sp. AK013]
EGKELDTHHPVIKLVASLARNRGVTFIEIHTFERIILNRELIVFRISDATYPI